MVIRIYLLPPFLKGNTDEGGIGGDDAAHALRCLLAAKAQEVRFRRLTGL